MTKNWFHLHCVNHFFLKSKLNPIIIVLLFDNCVVLHENLSYLRLQHGFYFDSKHISRVRWSKARLFCQISKFFTFVRRQVQYTTKHFPIISLFFFIQTIDLFLQKGKIIFTRLEQKVCFLLYLFSYSLIRELCNSLETSSMKTFYLRSICSYKKIFLKTPKQA